MDGSQLIICLIRWEMQLTYLKQKQTSLQLASLCSIMPQVIKNEHLIHYQQEKCQSKVEKYEGGPRMSMNRSDKTSQNCYFLGDYPELPGWFKGMENIIHKCGLWPNKGLKAQCDGFKCISGCTNCCSCRVLFCQPDFCLEKSHLEEYITSRGHIYDLYPRYQCKLDFIEQY